MHVMMTLQRLVEGVAVGVGLGVPLRLGVREPVRDGVAERVRDGVAVGDAVGEPVGVVVGVSVDDAVGGAVGDAVGEPVGVVVADAVDDAVAVGDAVGELVPLLVRVVPADALLLLALPAEPVADDAPGVPARNARSATASSVHRAAGGERMMIDATLLGSCDLYDSKAQSPYYTPSSALTTQTCRGRRRAAARGRSRPARPSGATCATGGSR